MATNVNFAYVDGSGPLLQLENNTTLTDTRIHGIHATGVGTFTVVDVLDSKVTTKIKFVNTTVSDTTEMYIEDFGVRFNGIVKVSAPASTTSFAVQYG